LDRYPRNDKCLGLSGNWPGPRSKVTANTSAFALDPYVLLACELALDRQSFALLLQTHIKALLSRRGTNRLACERLLLMLLDNGTAR
jgi:hypothetical protein